MNSFQKTILGISCIVLILSLAIIGYTLSKALHKDVFPPIIPDCPDYWDVSGIKVEGNSGPSCINRGINEVHNTTENGCTNVIEGEMFTKDGNTDDAILCERYKWAKKCNVVWDGVTNNSKPCKFDYY
tara:strand:- start:3533 stop:3916 length:384 start_codon:yes stop_codon:yes gene_type:complete